MASTVSGKPGPVPGAGGNCALARLAKVALTASPTKITAKCLGKEFTRPPKQLSLESLDADSLLPIVNPQKAIASFPRPILETPQLLERSARGPTSALRQFSRRAKASRTSSKPRAPGKTTS